MVENKIIKVIGISGSLRKLSTNTSAIKYAGSLLPADRFSFELINYNDFPVYNGDVESVGMPECVTRLHAKIMESDAIIFGCPEYNYSVSGPLKNMIDWVSRCKGALFDKKPIAIIGCSAGPSGGMRATYELRKMMIFFNGLCLNKEVHISANYQKFDKDANLTDETTQKSIQSQMTAYTEWINFCQKGAKI